MKRWKLPIIIIAFFLTVYNILPTIFYYSKPLKSPVDKKRAEKISKKITYRTDNLEKEAISWLNSYTKMLKVKTEKIELDKDFPSNIVVKFKNIEDLKKFSSFFKKAGALIPFFPAQLSLLESLEDEKKVIIQRRIPIHFGEKDYFRFSYKNTPKKLPEKLYREVVFDRASRLAEAIGGISKSSLGLSSIKNNPSSTLSDRYIISLSSTIIDYVDIFGKNSAPSRRYFSSFMRGPSFEKNGIDLFIDAISKKRDMMKLEKSPSQKRVETLLMKAESIIKEKRAIFSKKSIPTTYSITYKKLEEQFKKDPASKRLSIKIGEKSPIVDEIVIDFAADKIFLQLHKDLQKNPKLKKRYEQLIINYIAGIQERSDEKILSDMNNFSIKLQKLANMQSFIVLDLEKIAKKEIYQIKRIIEKSWKPKNRELSLENFPIYDYNTYLNLDQKKRSLCFVLYSPIVHSPATAPIGLRANSIYIMAKGLDRIQKKYIKNRESTRSKLFFEDLKNLQKLLANHEFLGYPGEYLTAFSEFSDDFIFEKSDYYDTLLKATREDFQVHGSKKFAVLEFSDIEERLLTLNRIETNVHDDLLRAKDEYQKSKISLDTLSKYDAPPPTKNLFLNNLKLSFKKYFRGDNRKILHWGLDLLGGKTVQLQLRDQNNRLVSDKEAITQGRDELRRRVNKMGVSDVKIRSLDSYIVLDFPGAQNFSASELIKASSMQFNVVNEKYSPNNQDLKNNVNIFLQEVWNRALVTNKKDIDSINEIAYEHLYGDLDDPTNISESAKILFENGLRIKNPKEKTPNTFDKTLSKIAIFRSKDYKKWEGQAHPLLIVFSSNALEGANLTDIKSGYDPTKGNFLSFNVKGYNTIDGKKISAKNILSKWTSEFSKKTIASTEYAKFTHGSGYRMAVILNDTIISAPTLESPLRDQAMISGSFSQREINKLSADLKAGSLTYTPHILSEKSVSPELGTKERKDGIFATIIALLVIVVAIISYYRFSGIVASLALIFNLLIMWAALQNIQATLTLASIAGIILSVGMAVDANVLIFERIKEELAIKNNLKGSVLAGYKKAFSAILDSNVTTIIAALILLHFDSGPIRGFALTLIIGIAASMFSTLFVTKYFFTKWVDRTTEKTLKMLDLIKETKFDFLKISKYIFVLSLIIIIAGIFSTNRSVLGMDFTGGYSIDIELEGSKKDYIPLVKGALLDEGATSQDFAVRQLNSPNNLRIQLGTSMELKSKPFHNMPISIKSDSPYPFRDNPRVSWIVDALNKKGLKISNPMTLDQSWTSMSGEMSKSMRIGASVGILLALLAILVYITIRFEFKFAISAMICLVHDLLITLASISILHLLGVAVQLDLHTVAALMTIIGYSLNDTIIIFDRIREDYKLMRRSSMKTIINHSLNKTLSRTSITSATTLLVLLALIIFGGATIFSFALVMILGIIYGTLSSLFIAAPTMLLFQKREEKVMVE